MSQSRCCGSCSHTRYPSSAWWALPRQLPDRRIAAPKAVNLCSGEIMGYYRQFPTAIPHLGVHSILLLTLPPLSPLAGFSFDLHVLARRQRSL